MDKYEIKSEKSTTTNRWHPSIDVTLIDGGSKEFHSESFKEGQNFESKIISDKHAFDTLLSEGISKEVVFIDADIEEINFEEIKEDQSADVKYYSLTFADKKASSDEQKAFIVATHEYITEMKNEDEMKEEVSERIKENYLQKYFAFATDGEIASRLVNEIEKAYS